MKKFKVTLSKILSLIMIFSLTLSNVTFADTVRSTTLFNFNDGEESLGKWEVDNGLSLSLEEYEEGNSALRVDIPEVSVDTTFTVKTKENINEIKKGDSVSFDVYLSEECDASVQLYYIGWQSAYNWKPERGKWHTFTINVTDENISELGLQIIAFVGAKGYALIDNVTVTSKESTNPGDGDNSGNEGDNSGNGGDNSSVGDDYNTLRPIVIFDESKVNGTDFWSSGVELEKCNNGWDFFPIKTQSPYTYDGSPSIKVHQLNPGYFGAGIAFNGWGSMNFSKYYENGYLEFYATGENGGESMSVQFSGNDNKPYTVIKLDSSSKIGNNDTETKWQKFQIPLKDLLENANDSVSQLKFSHDESNSVEQAMYLSNIRVVTTDTETVFPAVKVNQVGYFTNAEKTATVSRFKELVNFDENTNFNVVNADSNEVAYTGKLKLASGYDELSGEKVFKAEFTELKIPGKYYITIDGIDEKSCSFNIGDDIYDDILGAAVKYYYYQRSGIALTEEYAGQWAHEAFFMGDLARPNVNELELPFKSTMGTDNVQYLQTEGIEKGWFDAGDYGKYVDNGANTVKKLLYVYETYPELFKDNIGIPESGNGIPDILDEVAWELDFFLAMQDKDGGIYHSVEGLNVDPFRPENYGNYERHIADVDGKTGATGVKPTHTTAIGASALAQASVVYKDIDAAYSQKLLNAALKAWDYLESHLEPLTVTGPAYSNVRTDDVQRLAAASSLYRATGDEKFNKYVLEHYQDYILESDNVVGDGDLDGDLHSLNSGYFNDMWTAETNSLFLYDYMVAKNSDVKVAQFIKGQYLGYEEALQNRVATSVWANTSNGNLFWGSNGASIGRGSTHLDIFGELFGTYSAASEKVAINNMNYLLGVNPLNISFVTGFGENAVKEVFGNTFMNDDNDTSPAGYMPGGVNRYQGENISKFPGKRYEEGINWVTNEHCIDYNANLVGAIASAVVAGTDKSSNETIIKSINDVTAEIVKGSEYTLPSNLKAILVDGTEQEVSVSWDKQVDISKVGEQILYGSVANYSDLVKATIIVKASSEEGSKPNDDKKEDDKVDNKVDINKPDKNKGDKEDSSLPNTGGMNSYLLLVIASVVVVSGSLLLYKKSNKKS